MSTQISTKAMFLRSIFKEYVKESDLFTDALGFFMQDYPVIHDGERFTDEEYDYITAPVEEEEGAR